MVCELCGRELPQSEATKHHLIPKLKGGLNGPTVELHRICHNKLHSIFKESELAVTYNTVEKLKTHPDIQTFIKWVAKKDPYFYTSTKKQDWKNKR